MKHYRWSACPPIVNVDEALAVGDMTLTQMSGSTPAEYTFQKKNQIVTLGLKSFSVKIYGDITQIDPLFLFQRLTTVMQLSDDIELAFKHEFCSYPARSLCFLSFTT